MDGIPGQKALEAAEKGKLFKLVQLVHERPSVVHYKDTDGYTPLHRAAYNDKLDCVKFLVRKGADINAKTNDFWTPLHCAAKWNNVNTVEFLLRSKANVNAKSSSNNTPLHLVCSNGRYTDTCSIIQILLYHPNCDWSIVNDSHDTAFDIAKRSGPFYKLWSGVMTIFPDV